MQIETIGKLRFSDPGGAVFGPGSGGVGVPLDGRCELEVVRTIEDDRKGRASTRVKGTAQERLWVAFLLGLVLSGAVRVGTALWPVRAHLWAAWSGIATSDGLAAFLLLIGLIAAGSFAVASTGFAGLFVSGLLRKEPRRVIGKWTFRITAEDGEMLEWQARESSAVAQLQRLVEEGVVGAEVAMATVLDRIEDDQSGAVVVKSRRFWETGSISTSRSVIRSTPPTTERSRA